MNSLRQFGTVTTFAVVAVAITFAIFNLSGSQKIIEWSKSVGFIAFALAVWGAMIGKLSDADKCDFLPEWEKVAFKNAVANLKEQIWGCFFFTVVTLAVGVFAGMFSGTRYEEYISFLLVFLTVCTLGMSLFMPVFWGRISRALQFLANRESGIKVREAEIATLVKAMETPYQSDKQFNGYSRVNDLES